MIMLDLETLGVRPDAKILSIGAVRFDEHGIDSEFETNIDIESDPEAKIDGSTVLWWMRQSPIAQAETFLRKGMEPQVALSFFLEWSCGFKLEELWSNGPTFDEAILRGFFQRHSFHWPFDFRKSRDYRTIRDVGKRLGVEPVPFAGLQHTALGDARNQALNVIKIYEHLRKQ